MSFERAAAVEPVRHHHDYENHLHFQHTGAAKNC